MTWQMNIKNQHHVSKIYYVLAEYVNEILERDYNHFFNRDHDFSHEDGFQAQRIWYHWYINPENFTEKYDKGYSLFYYFFISLPFLLFFYYKNIDPHYRKKRFGHSINHCSQIIKM
jgi:hypothetical protein